MPGMKATGTKTDNRTRVIHDGAGNLGHGFLASLRHGQLGFLVDHPLDVFHDDDGVIDHDADGEHERQQGDGVGRIADG